MVSTQVEVLLGIVRDTVAERERIEAQLRDLNDQVKELNVQRAKLASEEQVLERTIERLSPSAPMTDAELDLGIESKSGVVATDDTPDGDWSDLGRTHAVQLAVDLLTREKGYGTPAEVEETLHVHGWNLARDNVGAALSYLRLHGKIVRKRRGEWATAPRPVTTAEVSTP